MLFGLAVAGFFGVIPLRTHAVVTFDLLHDTPETRGALKEELEVASRSPQPGAEEGNDLAAHDELESIWFSREKFLQIGEDGKARNQLNLLWIKQMERGVRNLPAYGDVLVREAGRDLRNGKLERAQEVISMAKKLSPESLPAYFTSASLIMKRGFWNLMGGGQELVKGMKALQRSYRLQSWAATNLFFTASVGFLLFFALFTLAVLLRHGGRLAHDMAEYLPRSLSPWAKRIIGWLLLLLPLLVGFPAWWWFMLAGAALWSYAERLPKAVLLLAALFLFSLPWQVDLASKLLSMHRQTFLEKVVAIREDRWSPEDGRVVRELAETRGSDPLAHFVAGLSAKRLGHFDTARDSYERALQVSPENAALWNNLGNLALTQKETDAAIERYLKAIEIDPGLFAPHYNLSLAYREKFLFQEGERESRRAVEIDPEANAYYTSISGQHYNRHTVDELPSVGDLWEVALEENKWQKATADHLWVSAGFLASKRIWPFALGVILLLGLGSWAFGAARGRAQACRKCGRVFCSRCQGKTGGELCSQCHHIFIKKEGVEARIRVRKMGDIKRRQRLAGARRVFLALLLPGGGHLSAGRFGAGAVFALPAAMLLAWVIFTRNAFPATGHLRLTAGLGIALPLAAAYVLWWALSLWLALRIEE